MRFDRRQEAAGTGHLDGRGEPPSEPPVRRHDADVVLTVITSLDADVMAETDEIDDVIIRGVTTAAWGLDDLEVPAGTLRCRRGHRTVEHDRDLVRVGPAPLGDLLRESSCGPVAVVPPAVGP